MSLCSGHHRALHDGQLVITGRAPQIRVDRVHVDASSCKAPPDDTTRDATLALTSAGYSRREAIAAVAAARAHVDARDLVVLVREAFRQAGLAP